MKRFYSCSLVLLALLAGQSFGKGFIAPYTVPFGITAGDFAGDGKLVDMNNDGILDIVTSDKSQLHGFHFNVLLGKGDGTFQAPILSAQITVSDLFSFVIGDLNGDGKMDVLAYAEENAGFVFLGDGQGNLSYTGNGPGLGIFNICATLGDINNDGKLDYVACDLQLKRVVIGLGNGDGTFQNPVWIPAGPEPTSVAIADLNGDGKPDLAVASLTDTGGGVSVLLGNGDGTFQSPITIDHSEGFIDLTTTDLNLDGHMDVVAAANNNSSIKVFVGNGDGTFQAGISYDSGFIPEWVRAADMNGDGKPDVIVFKQAGVFVFLGNGDGTLQAGKDFATTVGSLWLSIGDVNGDHAIDVITADNGLNAAVVMLNNGDGTLHAARSFPTSRVEENGLIADLNGDKKPDAVVVSFDNFGVNVALGNGDGTLQAPIFTSIPKITSAIAKGDFNNDGKIDLVVGRSNGTTDNILILRGKGNGQFAAGASYTVDAATIIATGDLNGDGKTDIVVGSTNAQTQVSTVTVFLGNGNGTFTKKASYAAGAGLNTLVIANADQDGKLDVVAGDFNFTTPLAQDLYVFPGNGDGTLKTPLISSVGPSIWTLAVGDFNKDGKNDLVVDVYPVDLVSLTAETMFLKGNGDGTFQTPVGLGSLGGYSGSYAIGDVNNDGKLDIVSSEFDTVLWLGKGDGTFSLPKLYPTGNFRCFGLADFNGDRLLDLLILNASAADVAIVTNSP